MTDTDLVERLRGLIERLEKLEGSSDLIDAEIAATLGIVPHTRAGSRMVPLVTNGETWPAYTASLDAAVGLVERVLPGWKKSFFENFEGLWIARVTSPRRNTFSTDYMRERVPTGSPNGAIALLIAALRALQEPSK